MQSDVTHSAGLFSLLAWFEKNRKPVMIGTASAAIVGLVAWFMIWQKGEKEIAAGQELSRVEMQFGPGQPGQAEAYLQLYTHLRNGCSVIGSCNHSDLGPFLERERS